MTCGSDGRTICTRHKAISATVSGWRNSCRRRAKESTKAAEATRAELQRTPRLPAAVDHWCNTIGMSCGSASVQRRSALDQALIVLRFNDSKILGQGQVRSRMTRFVECLDPDEGSSDFFNSSRKLGI
jgi:hypothetical protein